MGDTAHAQLHQVAGALLAVDGRVEKRQLPGPIGELEPDADRPDFRWGIARGELYWPTNTLSDILIW